MMHGEGSWLAAIAQKHGQVLPFPAVKALEKSPCRSGPSFPQQ